MILVFVRALAESFAAQVALVILVVVCAFAQRLAAKIALVILVFVRTLTQCLAAYITLMIMIGICTRTYHSVADIAYMVMVCVRVDVLRDRNCYVDILNRIVVCRVGRGKSRLEGVCSLDTHDLRAVPRRMRHPGLHLYLGHGR